MPGSTVSVIDIRKTELYKQLAATEMTAESQTDETKGIKKMKQTRQSFFFQFYTCIIQADQSVLVEHRCLYLSSCDNDDSKGRPTS